MIHEDEGFFLLFPLRQERIRERREARPALIKGRQKNSQRLL